MGAALHLAHAHQLPAAQLLRLAADLLRDNATKAVHEGRTRWRLGETDNRSKVVVDDQDEPSVLIETFAARLERVNAYLTLVGPETGLAVAQMLDWAARSYDANQLAAQQVWADADETGLGKRDEFIAKGPSGGPEALAVARAVLGLAEADEPGVLEDVCQPCKARESKAASWRSGG